MCFTVTSTEGLTAMCAVPFGLDIPVADLGGFKVFMETPFENVIN